MRHQRVLMQQQALRMQVLVVHQVAVWGKQPLMPQAMRAGRAVLITQHVRGMQKQHMLRLQQATG